MENSNLELKVAKDFSLQNGFKVITALHNSITLICLQLHIKTGSANESVLNSGYSHFVEHLTFKSTEKFPNNRISDTVPSLGGIINAYTDLDSTCYYLILPSEKLKLGIHILSELAYHADFSDDDVEIEKDIIIEEIKQYANDPEASFIDHIQSTYFISSPLKNPILGTIESIKSASKQKLWNFYKRKYTPTNSFLVVSGYFDPALVHKFVDEYFSGWNYDIKIKQTLLSNLEPEANGFRFDSKVCHINSNYIAFVLPELSEREDLNLAQLIITKAFGSGKLSRLHKRLVENDKTALEIRLHSISGLQNGIAVIQIVPTSPEYITEIIYAFYDEFKKMQHDFINSDEIELLKKELIYAWFYDFEYIESVAGNLANEELISNYKNHYDFPGKVSNVDLEEFYKCLENYWSTDFISIYYKGKYKIPSIITRNIKKLYTLPLTEFSKLDIETFTHNKTNLTDFIGTIKTLKLNTVNRFKKVTLDNGMNLVMIKIIDKPTVGIACTSNLSQLSETIDQFGINFFTSGLLLFGTEDKAYEDIQKECLHQGFSLKASQTLETTTLKGKCLSFNLESMLKLIAEVIQSPRFSKNYFEFVKSTVLDSIRREKTSPFYSAYNSWIKILLGAETNLNKPYGSISSVKQIKIEQLRNWYSSHYDLPSFTLSIAGDIDFDKVEDICNQHFTKRPNGASFPEHICYYNTADKRLLIKKTESDQSNIIIGGFGPPSSDISSNTAFYILSQVIAGDLSSRFFSILREKYGFAYQYGFDVTSIRDLGYWFSYITCDKTDFRKAYRMMGEILEGVFTKGITSDELVTVQNYLSGMHRLDMESVSWQAGTLSILYALGYDYDYFMNREQRIRAAGLDEIAEAARKYLKSENLISYIER